ncbi:hypothetical protein PDE_06529 [Penicillium oxalicum 114-2]|uniref:Uncharacterized protein n=1 Tax=Penicillium oxalicum (strain 114-2 / CGMCC 5302) TaxID=933388 RepID=S7ZMI8_PENO1|nr:hypothetical protein PDE_06529 [Penicillium oxalicum 114-2]
MHPEWQRTLSEFQVFALCTLGSGVGSRDRLLLMRSMPTIADNSEALASDFLLLLSLSLSHCLSHPPVFTESSSTLPSSSQLCCVLSTGALLINSTALSDHIDQPIPAIATDVVQLGW